MSESVLNNYAQIYVDLVLSKTRYDIWDMNWFTEGPFWRRTSMKFTRTYKMIPDYEIGDYKHGKSLTDIIADSARLEQDISAYAKTAPVEEKKRVSYLLEHVHQLNVRARMLAGETMPYDRVTEDLYSLVAPAYDYSKFDKLLDEMKNALPGHGSAAEKILQFRNAIKIPRDKLLTATNIVSKTFHDMSRQHMNIAENNMPRFRVRELPGSMQFLSILFGYDYDRIEYERSINLNYPWTVNSLIECIAHECEPGHLVYFEKRTKAFIDTCWPEMSIVSQHTSSNAFSEGSARQAIMMCFNNDINVMRDYERDVIFDAIGIDKQIAELMPLWHKFCEISGYAKLEATRNIWDGTWSKAEAGKFLEKYAFDDFGGGEKTIDSMPGDAGHYAAHDYARDVVRDYFNDVAPNVEDQWKLYEGLCSDDFSMKEIGAHTYRYSPLGIM